MEENLFIGDYYNVDGKGVFIVDEEPITEDSEESITLECYGY